VTLDDVYTSFQLLSNIKHHVVSVWHWTCCYMWISITSFVNLSTDPKPVIAQLGYLPPRSHMNVTSIIYSASLNYFTTQNSFLTDIHLFSQQQRLANTRCLGHWKWPISLYYSIKPCSFRWSDQVQSSTILPISDP